MVRVGANHTSRACLGGPDNRSLDSAGCPVFCCFAHCQETLPIAFRELRINEQIRIPQVRLFDDTTNEALGIVATDQARRLAVERELDLVEVAPLAQPPVCRLMDYGRYKFEELKKEKDSKRVHNVIRLKEMKLRPKISEHDFQTKYGYVRHFLEDGDKVKLTIMFRGREMVHQEYGRRLLDRLAIELKDVAIIERNPLVEGRNMIMILSPLTKKPARGSHHGEGDAHAHPHGSHAAGAPGADGGTAAPRPAVAADGLVVMAAAPAQPQVPSPALSEDQRSATDAAPAPTSVAAAPAAAAAPATADTETATAAPTVARPTRPKASAAGGEPAADAAETPPQRPISRRSTPDAENSNP